MDTSGTPGSTMFTDMFSYTQAGEVAGKRLRVTQTQRETNPNTHQQFTQTAQGDLNLAYTYNNEGKVTAVTYPTDSNSTAANFSYSYDSMMRLSTMTDSSNYSQPVVNNVQYNAASQLTAINYYGTSETRQYNNLFQLTNIAAGSALNVTYNYTPGGNSGKITSSYDAISGEAVVYQYDALNRLISAQGNGWAQTQAYDGFGNLTSRIGYGTAQSTTISTPVNATTNQLSGYTYDANGNLISTGYTYDVENRMSYANSGGAQYFYDAQNKRVWQANCTTSGYCNPGSTWVLNLTQDTVNLFGADGKQLASYQVGGAWNPSGGATVAMGFTYSAVRSYFGGRLVGQYLPGNGIYKPVIQDRLGSVGKYYPYGEERNSPQLPNDQVKFATYTRDSATGNDYADQRYYTSTLGRFITPDPYQASPEAHDPGSWNAYAYTRSDPVNRADPEGEDDCTVGGTLPCTVTVTAPAPGSGSTAPGNVGGGGGGGGGGSSSPTVTGKGAKNDIPNSLDAAWYALSADCRSALITAIPNTPISGMLAALSRAEADESVFQAATAGTDVSWEMLAAIAIRESGVQDVNENDGAGVGVGVFQITVSNNNQNPANGPTAAEANNLTWAASYAAQLLNSNMAYLANRFPNFTPTQLLQATAASYNMNPYKPGNFTGNPNTIDVGTAHGNYGSNILGLMNCF